MWLWLLVIARATVLSVLISHHIFKSLRLINWMPAENFCKGHDDVIRWRYWPFVRGIHRSPVNSPHKGQWRGALMYYLICARINSWVNSREAGDLRRLRGHYDVNVMRFVVSVTETALNFIWVIVTRLKIGCQFSNSCDIRSGEMSYDMPDDEAYILKYIQLGAVKTRPNLSRYYLSHCNDSSRT